MQRSHLLRTLAVAIALLGTQCLDSISDDCTKTLTCEDEPQPVLQPNCEWEYPDGRPWPGGPSFDRATNTWRWPDGRATATQTFGCIPADAGVDAGPSGPDCRTNLTCDPGQICDPATGDCVQCIADTECAGNMAMGDAGAATVCDRVSHRCVACLENDQCSGDTAVCKVDAASSLRNACVECVNNDTCSGLTPICDDRSNECTATCQTAADCVGDKKACNTARNICVECTANADCTTPGKALCDTESNLCVECVDDGQCAASGRVCDVESHSCVQCKTDTQCMASATAASLPYCDGEAKQCVQCTNDLQCTSGDASRCSSAHVCTGCTDSSQCENGFECRAGECVQCTSDANCTNGQLCETVRGVCVQCFETSQCIDPGAARCEISPDPEANATRYTCVGCQEEEDCTGGGKGLPPLCDLLRGGGTCSECTTAEGAADCFPLGANKSRCQNGTCQVCSVDADCTLFAVGDAPACKPDVGCVQCTDSTDCTDTTATPVCKLNADDAPAAINTCVQCLTNADCRTNPGASRCEDNACVPCVANPAGATDADCVGVDSNGNAAGGTPLNVCDSGTCVQCTGPRRAACGQDVCNSATKLCTDFGVGSAATCTACVSDAHCGSTACVARDQGLFCLPRQVGTACPDSGATIGFVNRATVLTIDTASAAVCEPRLATCPAFAAYRTAIECSDANDDEACGTGGVCGQIPNGGADFQCTIPCVQAADCLSGGCVADLCEL